MSINEPITLPCGITLPNRIIKAPMSENLADEYGAPRQQLVELYRKWGHRSHCGLLITGNIQVDRHFLERSRNVCLDKDFPTTPQQAQKFRDLAAAGKNTDLDTKIFVQLGHAGLQSVPSVAKIKPGPSERMEDGVKKVFELSEAEIKGISERFAYSASKCKEFGFDGIEIHSAHGYLLSSFMNPRKNKRTDKYGGSLENRARLLLETVQAIKAATKDEQHPFGVAVKLNSSDFQQGGFTLEECAQVAEWLQQEGVDFLELSGGNYESPAMISGDVKLAESTKKREAFFTSFAAHVVKELKSTPAGKTMPIMLSGGFRTREGMELAIKEQNTDLIGVGRPLCCNAHCTAELLEGKREALPNIDTLWELPWYVGYGLLRKVSSTVQKMHSGMVLYSCFKAELLMAEGEYDGEKEFPDLLVNSKWFTDSEKTLPLEMKGFKHDDPYLTDAIRQKMSVSNL